MTVQYKCFGPPCCNTTQNRGKKTMSGPPSTAMNIYARYGKIGVANAVIYSLAILMGAVALGMGIAVGVEQSRYSKAKKKSAEALAGGLPSNQVTPLTWSDAGYYAISFSLGTDVVTGKPPTPVTSAFDSGSSRFIVATAACSECTSDTYNPATSSTSVVVYDATTPGSQNPCTSQVAYVSQTNTVQQYADTLTMPRVAMPTAWASCGSPPNLPVGAPAQSFAITGFPIGGITSASGTGGGKVSTANVFGMAPVQAATVIDVSTRKVQFPGFGPDGVAILPAPGAPRMQYYLPYCEIDSAPGYESALLQSVQYYNRASTGPSEDLEWCMAVDGVKGFVLFTTPPPQLLDGLCGGASSLKKTPMVPSPAGSDPTTLTGTPYRYYIVGVTSATADGVAIPNFPSQLMVDTGTTISQIPGDGAADALLAAKSSVVITLTGGVQLVYNDIARTVTPAFEAMAPEVAVSFSPTMSLGIWGAKAMMGRFIDFNITQKWIGFSTFAST